MSKFYILAIALFCLYTSTVCSQINIKVKVESISVLNTADCDAGVTDNSDFLFEFKAIDNSAAALTNNAPVAGSIGMCNYAYVNENNGPYTISTNTPGLAIFSPNTGEFFDHTYNCYQSIPTAITIVWRGYQNDDVTSPSTTPIATGITTINTTTVALISNITNTTQTVQYTASSTDGCVQTYQITFSIITSVGSFIPLHINDIDPNFICAGASNGTLQSSIIGGFGTVQIDWSNDGLGDFNDAANLSGLTAGTYTLIVKDALNCGDTTTASITSAPIPTITNAFSVATASVCSGQTSVSYSIAPSVDANYYYWSYSGVGAVISSSGTNSVSINYLNNASTGTLSVYAINTCSSSTTLTMAVTVNTTPTVVIGGNSAMCDNAQDVLTASGAINYSWNTGATTSSIIITPTTTTIYTVTGTNNGCTATTHYTMIVIPSPTLSVTGATASVCPNQSVTLNATGNGNLYFWSDGFNGSSHTVSSPVTTIYTVTATYTNTCYSQNTYTLNVYASPTIAITGTTIACSGKTISLTASGANSYMWSNGSNTATITYTTSGLNTLTVTGTNTLTSCSNTQTISVNSFSAGLISITGNTMVCSNSTNVYTVNGSTFYLWNDGATANTNTITVTNPTTISVVGTTMDGCKDSTFVTVNTTLTPSLSITGLDSICGGQSVTLTAISSTGNYNWSTGATTSSIVVAPNATSVFTITTANGDCSVTKTHQINVKSTPSIVFSIKATLCTIDPAFTLTATPTGGVFSGTSVTGTSFDPSIGAGSYPITYGVANSNGCSSSKTETIAVVVCNSIEEFNNSDAINVFPNPASDAITIHSATQLKLIIMTDITGKVINTIKTNLTEETLTINNLNAGIYFCKIILENNHQRMIKFIKN